MIVFHVVPMPYLDLNFHAVTLFKSIRYKENAKNFTLTNATMICDRLLIHLTALHEPLRLRFLAEQTATIKSKQTNA
jgi:hypothetical protein